MLSRRVVDLLVERGKVSRVQVDEAARMKTFFGGMVESHLLRLGHVDEIALADVLTEITGVPYAWAEHLRTIDPEARKGVPVPVLQKHRMCPFKVVDRRIRVAMLDPRDRTGMQQIQTATGLAVEPWVTTEYRLHRALERHFGVRLPGVRAITPAPPTAPDVARPRTPRPLPSPPAGPWVRSPENGPVDTGVPDDLGRSLAAEEPTGEALADFEPSTSGDLDSTSETSAPAVITMAGAAEPLSPPMPDAPAASPAAEAAIRVLDEFLSLARDRDAIADALLTFAARQAARCGLFAVGRDGIRGIAGRGRGFETTDVARVTLEPGSRTIFDTAIQSRDFYFGVVPALPANRDLYTALGGRLPEHVLIVPIVLKDRTVALLYLDNDDRPMSSPDITTMRRLAAKTGIAFELLLLRTKLRAI